MEPRRYERITDVNFLSGRKGWVIAADACIILLLIAYVVGFTVELRQTSTDNDVQRVVDTIESLQRHSVIYLDDSCRINRDWSYYAGWHIGTAEEMLDWISELNSDERVMAQIVMIDTFSGVSSQAKAGTQGDRRVSYARYDNLTQELMTLLEDEPQSDVVVTSAFANNVNGEQCIAFASLISVLVEGVSRQAFLMRVEPVAMIQEYCGLKDAYNGIQISMVNRNGAYLFRANMLKNSNFYEFLRTYNDLTYPQAEAVREKINSDPLPGKLTCLNSQGNKTICAYSSKTYNGWFLVGSIEVSALSQASVQWSLLLVTTLAFALLIAVNSVYFLLLNKRLRESLAAVEHANAAKTRFLSTMSHDIRTPMNAILGMAAIAQSNLDNREKVEECLRKLLLAGKHLLTLINDVLDISKVESGKFTLSPTTFSLAEEVENLINIIYPQACRKDIRLDVRLQNVLHEELFADKLRLNQIFINILSNAVKYTPSGGSIQVLLREEALDEENRLRLIYRVQDTGIGMSQEYIKTLYEPFTREKDGRIDKIEGSGLGMAIAGQMVSLMGGTIDVQSEQGVGTTFTVRIELPFEEEKMPPVLRAKRVLAMGSPDMRMYLSEELHALDVQTVFADTAEDAAAILSREDINAVIIEHQMPEWNALNLADALRKACGGMLPPVVLSAYDAMEVETAAQKAGVRAFLPKPVFRSRLIRLFDRLERKDAEKEAEAREDAQSGAGMHLLVAEDNDLNWEILQALLDMRGATAERAVNGRECVERIREAKDDEYNLIFMDIQMPVMNGYEAACAIRQLDDVKKANIPIVAMTADAFAEDVAACRMAGMNGHIAKPVEPKILTAALKQYAKKTRETES